MSQIQEKQTADKTFRIDNGPAGRSFRVNGESLLTANQDDESLCEFINAAGIGDTYQLGGAQPDICIERTE